MERGRFLGALRSDVPAMWEKFIFHPRVRECRLPCRSTNVFVHFRRIGLTDNKRWCAYMVNYGGTSEYAYTVNDASANLYVLEPCLSRAWICLISL